MVDAEITINDQTEGASTANVDTKSLIGAGGKTVHRQVVNIGDPSTFGRVAEVNANNELKVKQTDAVPVTDNGGALTVDGSVSISGTVATDPIDDPARDLGKVDIASLDQYTPQDVDTGAPTVNALPVVLKKTGTGAPDLGTTTDPMRVDPTGTTTQPVSIAATIAVDPVDEPLRDNGKIDIAGFDVPLPTGTNNIGDVDVASIAAGDNNIGNVDIVSLPDEGQQTMANSISVAVASDQSNVPVSQATASNLNAQVVGNAGDAATDGGNPVKIGIIGRTTNRTAVTDGQRVNVTGDDLGRQVIVLNQVRDLVIDGNVTLTNTTETTILAQAASTFHDLVLVLIANTSATAVRIDFRDATAGSVRFSMNAPAGATVGFAPPVPIKQTTVNNNWTAQLSASVTDVRIFVQAVKNV